MSKFSGKATDARAWLRDAGVDHVRVVWSDLGGLARGKMIPAERFEDAIVGGAGFCAVALTFDGLSNPVPNSSLGGEGGYYNIKAFPDLSTLCLAPHLPRTALCIADPHLENGSEAPQSPRTFAKRVAADLSALKYTCKAAPELEAYILGPGNELLEPGMPCYGAETLGRFSKPLARMVEIIDALTPVEAWHHEHGPGQFEINVAPRPMLEAADALFLLRTATREASVEAGGRVTWMAKPFSGLNGSACQINFSIWSCDGKTSLFYDKADPLHLSGIARGFVGGLLTHLDEIAAILLPNANSYRRIVPGHFAPISKAWGIDNRLAAVRVIVDTPASTRVEVRVGGADIAAHLALPALVAAGLDGVTRNLDPGPPAYGDLEAQDAPRVVDDWRSALEQFEGSAWAARALSPELHQLYAQVKRQEYERWRRYVSDFDRSEYGSQF